MKIPLLPAKVKAGGYGSFESPALDFPEDSIDLLKYLIKDKETTFFAHVTGDSLDGIGVFDGDLLIIQKGLFPRDKDIVVVFYQGEFYVKRYLPKYKENSLNLEEIRLKSENPNYTDMYISEETDFQLWGVATYNIHQLRK
jgi:DNA polymerase V